MRVEFAQQARNRALIESLLGGNGVGGVLFDDGKGIHDALDLLLDIVRGRKSCRGTEQNRAEAEREAVPGVG